MLPWKHKQASLCGEINTEFAWERCMVDGQASISGASRRYNKPSLPTTMEQWGLEDVRQWLLHQVRILPKHADKLFEEEVTGPVIQELTKEDLSKFGIPLGQIMLIIRKRDNHLKGVQDKEGQETGKQHKEDAEHATSSTVPSHKITKTSKTGNAHHPGKSNDSLVDDENLAKKIVKTTESKAGVTSTSPADINASEVTKIRNTKSVTTTPIHNQCSPSPFGQLYTSHRYIKGSTLPPETGKINYLEPVHEYKLYKCQDVDEVSRMKKFCNEVLRFASGCMNRRTNGTIHFGIGDTKSGYSHGEVVGVHVNGDKSKFEESLTRSISKHFKNDSDDAVECIGPPRFVEVISESHMSLNEFVIEVDIEPGSQICKETVYEVDQMVLVDNNWKIDKGHIFVRKGSATKDLMANQNERVSWEMRKKLDDNVKIWTKERAAKEKKGIQKKRCDENGGLKLMKLITAGKESFDDSGYEHYILVVNKADKKQLEHLEFVKHINWFAVLDFDPESDQSGLCNQVRSTKAANLHFPEQFLDSEDASSLIKNLHLYNQTSWIFCNGRSNVCDKKYRPMDPKQFQKERSNDFSQLVNVICRRDIMPAGKYLVVFLVLLKVEQLNDPMMEAYFDFYKTMKGLTDILLITDDSESFESWISLAHLKVDEIDVQNRSVYNMPLKNVNATLLKMQGATRSNTRYLCTSSKGPCVLAESDEDSWSYLSVICQNECKDTDLEKDKTRLDDFRKHVEQAFYKGGKVSPWNFYFAERSKKAFIKRDSFETLSNTIESALKYDSSVKTVHLFHHPGCGGTTLAWNMLWNFREKYRCAAVKDSQTDFQEISRQVVDLLMYGEMDSNACYTPVLLLVDNLDENEGIRTLQSKLRAAIDERTVRYDNTVVIILNCMRSQEPEKRQKDTILDSVILKQQLSISEQETFKQKLQELQKEYDTVDTFLSFMIMAENFDEQYIENAARNMLKGIDKHNKSTKLIKYLALLNAYVKNSCISVATCEALLDIPTVQSTIWMPLTLQSVWSEQAELLLQIDRQYSAFKSVRMKHHLVAEQVVKLLENEYQCPRCDIAMELLREDDLFALSMGREMLTKFVKSMIITRDKKEHGAEADTRFSRLLEDIMQTNNNEKAEEVLLCTADRFSENAFVAQALARFYYLQKSNFTEARKWAKKAKGLASTSSYIADTNGQICKHEMKEVFDLKALKSEKDFLSSDRLEKALTLTEEACGFFKECQRCAKKEEDDLNLSGYFGEVDVGLYFVQLLGLTKLFDNTNPVLKSKMISYLKGSIDLHEMPREDEEQQKTVNLLKSKEYVMINLYRNIKESLETLDDATKLLKPRHAENDIPESRHLQSITKMYKQYIATFCPDESEQQQEKGSYSELQSRTKIERRNGHRLAGLMFYLTSEEKKKEDTKKDLSLIVHEYEKIISNSPPHNVLTERCNLVMATIILHWIHSTRIEGAGLYARLQQDVKEIMKITKKNINHLDLFFLATLFLWPTHKSTENDILQLQTSIETLHRAFRKKFNGLNRTRQTLAFFFLGKDTALDRFLPRFKIDRESRAHGKTLRQLWLNGDIFKHPRVKDILQRMNGTTDERGQTIYLDHKMCSPQGSGESIKIPVRPVNLSQIRRGRSIEQVSFFVGFALDGPIAYNVQPL
uniref:sterile alpha motif domain-containing protein 9-like n=1 Tax=Myxine glutinosa TaxID=7769 RepID=UPI00358FF563